jgi:hypothetical protein
MRGHNDHAWTKTTQSQNHMNAEYFINKLSAIPDERWTVGPGCAAPRGYTCALGHCFGYSWLTLINLFRVHLDIGVGDTNDGKEGAYQQSTPKARILAALADIKAKGF